MTKFVANNVMYKDVPNGALFRLSEKESICSRSLHDDGVFVKVGNSHAVRIQAGMSEKTIIPGLKVKCSVLPGKHDTSYIKDWNIVNQPFTSVE